MTTRATAMMRLIMLTVLTEGGWVTIQSQFSRRSRTVDGVGWVSMLLLPAGAAAIAVVSVIVKHHDCAAVMQLLHLNRATVLGLKTRSVAWKMSRL